MLLSLYFSNPGWLWPGAALLLLMALCLFWSYRVGSRGWPRWVCPGLKLVGFAALLLCLLEPLWSSQRARPGANLLAIVADNSASLKIKDRGSERSRADVLRQILDPLKGSWQETLESSFEVRRYFADSRLQDTRDFGDMTFDGRSSALLGSLRTLAERYRGRNLAGIVLLTDGNATDIPEDADLSGLPPIYPVVIGETTPARDLALGQVRVSKSDFEDAPVSIQAEARAIGYQGEALTAQLTDSSGKVVAEQKRPSRRTDDSVQFQFRFRPEKPGLSFYRFSVRTESEAGNGKSQRVSEEASLANNSTVVAVDRGQGPYRILYVAGRPNWEFKFLNRAVQADDQLQLVGLIRVARREPKFNFIGRAGETSNPLFRGYGAQSPEEVERYDQPVLVRLYTRDDLELRGGFPSKAEDLYGYHAVIVDDIEAQFFTPDQATLLQKFVSERGGGFLMLGGMECFQQGNYDRTPVGDMLPVYLDRSPEPVKTNTWRLDFTREGWLQPWLRLRDTENGERDRLETMAGFQVLNPVRSIKPGASVLATVSGQGGQTNPAVVMQRFGRGRTGALLIGDVWRWGLHDADAHRDMDKAWRQMIRALIADVPNRVEVAVEPANGTGNGAVLIQVRARDEKYQPMEDAVASLEIQPVLTAPGTNLNTASLRMAAEPVLSDAGLYQATFVPRFSGGFRVEAVVTNAAGVEVGRSSAGWSTDLEAEEFKSLTPNRAWLESTARKTGGQVVSPAELASLARALPTRTAPVMEPWSFPLWHTPALFAFALACFVSEWGLRRWKGLP
jgi:hypothetical protein